MSKFIKRVILFLLPILIIAYPLDVFLSTNLYRTGNLYGDVPIMKDAFEGNINADILIIGSSRAEMHFNPEIIEKHSGLSAFNFGESLVDWNLIRFRLDTYLRYNRSPDYIIANVDAAMFMRVASEYKVRPHFLPYLLFNKDFMELYDVPIEDYLFPLARYVGYRKLPIVVFSLWLKDSTVSTQRIKGFSPVNRPFDDRHLAQFREKDYSNLDISPTQFYQYLQAKLPHATIIGVHTPILIESIKEMDLKQLRVDSFQAEFEERGWIFLDYSFGPISQNKNYFYNTTHMNYKGAERFTRTLMRDLDSLGVFSAK